MFLFLVPWLDLQGQSSSHLGSIQGTEVNYCPHIDMKLDGRSSPGASQTDMLGEDWMIVGVSTN